MYTLSLTLIIKNEERHLPNVLKYAHIFADEIVIVDTGSTDNSIEVARKYTDKIFQIQWNDDFSKARNFGISKCKSEYIIWLDADDIITENDANKINELKKSNINWDVYYIPYDYGHCIIKRERIFKNNGGIKFIYPIHECLKIDGYKYCIDNKDITITHNKIFPTDNSNTRNYRILKKNINKKIYMCDSRMLSLMGGAACSVENYGEALKYYKKAINISKKSGNINVMYKYEMAKTLFIMKEYDKSIKKLLSVLKLSMPHKDVWMLLGKNYYYVKRFDDAIFAFNTVLNSKNYDKDFLQSTESMDKALIYDWVSLCYSGKGDYFNALIYVDHALNQSEGANERLFKNKKYWQSKIGVANE